MVPEIWTFFKFLSLFICLLVDGWFSLTRSMRRCRHTTDCVSRKENQTAVGAVQDARPIFKSKGEQYRCTAQEAKNISTWRCNIKIDAKFQGIMNGKIAINGRVRVVGTKTNSAALLLCTIRRQPFIIPQRPLSVTVTTTSSLRATLTAIIICLRRQTTLSLNRVPDTTECFPWDDGSTSALETRFGDITGSAGSVLVSRTGDGTATSAYGYNYSIDFVGTAVRGNMDLRYVHITRQAPIFVSKI